MNHLKISFLIINGDVSLTMLVYKESIQIPGNQRRNGQDIILAAETSMATPQTHRLWGSCSSTSAGATKDPLAEVPRHLFRCSSFNHADCGTTFPRFCKKLETLSKKPSKNIFWAERGGPAPMISAIVPKGDKFHRESQELVFQNPRSWNQKNSGFSRLEVLSRKWKLLQLR